MHALLKHMTPQLNFTGRASKESLWRRQEVPHEMLPYNAYHQLVPFSKQLCFIACCICSFVFGNFTVCLSSKLFAFFRQGCMLISLPHQKRVSLSNLLLKLDHMMSNEQDCDTEISTSCTRLLPSSTWACSLSVCRLAFTSMESRSATALACSWLSFSKCACLKVSEM